MSKVKEITYSEVDQPIQCEMSSMTVQKEDPREIEKLEEGRHRRRMAQLKIVKASWLLTFVLIALLLLVVGDTVALNLGWKQSELLSKLVEFGTYVATTLLGFLFAGKMNGGEH